MQISRKTPENPGPPQLAKLLPRWLSHRYQQVNRYIPTRSVFQIWPSKITIQISELTPSPCEVQDLMVPQKPPGRVGNRFSSQDMAFHAWRPEFQGLKCWVDSGSHPCFGEKPIASAISSFLVAVNGQNETFTKTGQQIHS